MAAQCAAEGVDHPGYLLRLAELELIDRHQRMVERRIRAARFPAVKSLDTFDFTAIPSVNKALVMELARCEYVQRRENIIAVGNSGTGKTHIALGLGLAACQRGMSVGFTTAAALVHELMEARDERRLLNLQRKLFHLGLLIIDELGFVPLSPTGAELLFEVCRDDRVSSKIETCLRCSVGVGFLSFGGTGFWNSSSLCFYHFPIHPKLPVKPVSNSLPIRPVLQVTLPRRFHAARFQDGLAALGKLCGFVVERGTLAHEFRYVNSHSSR